MWPRSISPIAGRAVQMRLKGKVIGVVATYLSGTASVSRTVRAAPAHPADRPEGPASAALHLLCPARAQIPWSGAVYQAAAQTALHKESR